ncbi:MAG: Asp-tRNA(Asn)/Glu-tRNA(Gln) amidotransferase subunit GatB, partial [Cyanobacteria bacterium NC_groundwater_1444_Ag_S-0.65um_54_12]|nr:Asp-tRNA(Asn)/Glu-tRNA(Gln) amidotransferase subunit GatB [Cyanobacteria bacterium NC_groundwater_1444_Ag_S-0.65um_54_12]
RKNYFYPDLPKGYQISQYDRPLGMAGYLEVLLPEGAKRVRIHRLHLEEDAGKLVHAGAAGLAGADYSLVDLNRAGVPLLEIVSEPDLRSAEEAKTYLQELRLLLMVLGVNDGRMAEGSLRCDANVSIRPRGSTLLMTRTEIKNLNSFKFLQRALDYEIARQIRLSQAGETIVQETRLWSEERQVTYAMRSKEEASDYRYFPEPDLVPLAIAPSEIATLRESLPELPAARRQRYEQLGLSPQEGAIIAADLALTAIFDQAVPGARNPKSITRWLLGDVSAIMSEHKLALAAKPLFPEQLRCLADLVDSGELTANAAKKILPQIMLAGKDPRTLIAELGLAAISDEAALRELVTRVLANYPDQAAEYRSGKAKVLIFLVGQVMRESQGRATPALVHRLLQEALR